MLQQTTQAQLLDTASGKALLIDLWQGNNGDTAPNRLHDAVEAAMGDEDVRMRQECELRGECAHIEVFGCRS